MVLARRWIGPTVAVGAGAILAVHPTLLIYTVLFMTETLFLFLLLAFFVLWTWPGAGRRTTVGAGVLLGLTVLTRSTLLPFVAALVVWTLARSAYWPRAGARIRALLLALVVTLTVAPWTVRNAIVYHEFSPIDCYTMNSLWEGNNPDGWNVGIVDRYWSHSDSPGERERFAFDQATAFLRTQPLAYPIEKLGRIVVELLAEKDFIIASYYLPYERFGSMSPNARSALCRVVGRGPLDHLRVSAPPRAVHPVSRPVRSRHAVPTTVGVAADPDSNHGGNDRGRALRSGRLVVVTAPRFNPPTTAGLRSRDRSDHRRRPR